MNSAKELNRQKELFYLWWHCPVTENRDMAGVAYYNEDSGDYRLILNFFPDNNYFLKCMGGDADRLRYRLVSVKEKGGKGSRFFQGDGFLNCTNNEVVIHAAPFSKLLVLSLKEQGPTQSQTKEAVSL